VSTHYFRFNLRGNDERRRSPVLERLLARADPFHAVTEWRADAFQKIAPGEIPTPGIAAAALYAGHGAVPGASVFIATPVHYAAEMTTVRMAAEGILSLRESEALSLAADFNRVWRDSGIRLMPGRKAELFCVMDEALDAATRDPEDVLGERIEAYLPTGNDARRLRLLMSEIEMWLFAHEVNRARTAAPAVTGLWLWGGGPVLQSLPPLTGWTAGNDVFFRAFGAGTVAGEHSGASGLAGIGAQPGSEDRFDAEQRWLSGSGVAVIGAQPGSEGWFDSEQRWLARSAAAWRSGRLERLDLSAGSRCFSVTSRGRWRFWRRSRPWWEYFE
jgi:hypothetical protein